MVGYRIENTLTENGYVSRGVCEADDSGMLRRITERMRIVPRPGGAAYQEEGAPEVFLPAGTLVSMNLWAFGHGMLDEIRARFESFLRTRAAEDPLKAEFYLPSVPDALIRENRARVRVLETPERWYGVTYREDLAAVQAACAPCANPGSTRKDSGRRTALAEFPPAQTHRPKRWPLARPPVASGAHFV